MTLLELVLIQMNFRSVDELGKMDKWQKRYLADALEIVDPYHPPLDEWNRLLTLTLGIPEASDCKTARDQLISGLCKK